MKTYLITFFNKGLYGCSTLIAKTVKEARAVFIKEFADENCSIEYVDGRNLVEVIIEDLSAMGEIGYNVVYDLLNASEVCL